MGKKTSYLTELIEKSKRWRAAGGGQDETSSSDEEDEDDGRGVYTKTHVVIAEG